MNKFKVGDRVIIARPGESVEEYTNATGIINSFIGVGIEKCAVICLDNHFLGKQEVSFYIYKLEYNEGRIFDDKFEEHLVK